MHFVDAALANSNEVDGVKKSYLIEEVIDGKFIKYINNDSPELLPMENLDQERRAKFFAFAQHVQYFKTESVFISDLQDGDTLLTDPQITTNPSITKGQIFVSGNLPSAFTNFKRLHTCNYFCKWYKLHSLLLPFSNSKSHIMVTFDWRLNDYGFGQPQWPWIHFLCLVSLFMIIIDCLYHSLTLLVHPPS
ncbi:hypothetical protein PC9H_008337 [Pleurotus ostreatus]|uniref:Alpha-type protein kinase domain-containing protein n=1 Tax=Pleurotus ostreatus TaxID=5322 RepID=A0A8H6ZNJ5_PLEOS|nr:uncharacterized protein PC9H_008337 [Pleurotus ostreatus]KAF7425975.1 hypothetical protein PC9H_008337 [Pleurotus ostreatus]